jgi:hypothetical protein
MARLGPAQTGPAWPSPNRPGLAQPKQARLGPAQTGPAWPGSWLWAGPGTSLCRRISNWQATKMNLYCVYQRTSSCIHSSDALHPVSFLWKCLDDHGLILYLASSYARIGANNECDVIDDVLPLSFLVMKGDRMRCQRMNDVFDVNFGTASNTDMEIWKV